MTVGNWEMKKVKLYLFWVVFTELVLFGLYFLATLDDSGVCLAWCQRLKSVFILTGIAAPVSIFAFMYVIYDNEFLKRSEKEK